MPRPAERFPPFANRSHIQLQARGSTFPVHAWGSDAPVPRCTVLGFATNERVTRCGLVLDLNHRWLSTAGRDPAEGLVRR